MSFHDWIGQLAVVVLLCGVADLLVPEGGLKGYARTILGLIVLVTVLRPALGWVHAGVDWSWAAAAAPASSLPDEAAQTRDVFRQLLADEAVRLASAVPGVRTATAAVRLAAGEPPTIEDLRLQVEAAPGVVPVRVGRSSPEADRLAHAVAGVVAPALGVDPKRVRVEVAP